MTGRAPNWKLKGYKSPEEYRAACGATRKTRRAAMAATKARNTTARILEKMWDQADFDKPRVTITKEQLMGLCSCSFWSVRSALKELRDEGAIKPVHGWEGGRGKATTWRLLVPGSSETPSELQVQLMEHARDRDAAWRFLSGKYGPMKALELMGDKPEDQDLD
ncbi:hypothetical protein KBY28_07720 [Ruegeria pomeroyi]|uniref:hypothetical protein n=1 Tax=Ruegeria pomeroyi TaxID=89184 RepID=UPI001F23F7DB|nr:hypothetical protein [Ruegeria pomeroyi]MCE8508337.1 hypothetical protein [Ruegeria pomeroyi]